MKSRGWDVPNTYINACLSNASSDSHSMTFKKYFKSLGNGFYEISQSLVSPKILIGSISAGKSSFSKSILNKVPEELIKNSINIGSENTTLVTSEITFQLEKNDIKNKQQLEMGITINNKKLSQIFKCSEQGGMRRSHKTNSLILISDHTKGTYDDHWDGSILYYTGMGLIGDQDITLCKIRL